MFNRHTSWTMGRWRFTAVKAEHSDADAIGHPLAVPMHCGLFDEIDMNDFLYEPKVVPEFYEEIGVK